MNNALKTILLSLLSLVAVSFASCETDKTGTTSRNGNIYLKGPGQSNEPEVEVSGRGGKTHFVVTSDSDWTLAVDAESETWISADTESGKANADKTVVLTIAANDNMSQGRYGWVTVKTDKDIETFTVYQLKGENVWGLNPSGMSDANFQTWQIMHEFYYWNEAVRNLGPASFSSGNFGRSADVFLNNVIESLPWADVQDRSNGENPATIDGQWKADRSGRDHIYSFIQPVSYATRAGVRETSFGFGIEPFQTGESIYEVIISWVQPGGPADDAGLKRGTVITKHIAGTGSPSLLTSYNLMAAFYNQTYSAGQMGGNTMTLADKTGRTYTITSETGSVSPIIDKRVIEYNGKKVAYFAYSQFEPGSSRQGNRNNFDEAMRNAFGEFKANGATELVIDLRYNGGGVVNCANVLASLAGNVTSNQIFGKLLRNDNWRALSAYQEDLGAPEGYISSNPEIMYFNDEPNSMRLNRVYCLMTKASASASELVVNALRGVGIDVIIIGTETNGKNVGMDVFIFQDRTYIYQLAPITFKNLNAKDFCDYAGGFQPEYKIDEFRAFPSGTVYELGDPREELLKSALLHIDGKAGQIVQDTRTRADRYFDPMLEQLTPPEVGMIMHTFNVLEDGTLEMVE